MYYVDTSVLVTSLNTTDPYYHSTIDFLGSSLSKKIISPLVLTELISVISRKIKAITFHRTIRKLTGTIPKNKEMFIIMYLLRKFNLSVLPTNSKKTTLFGMMPSIFATAISLASDIKLKTLDLLHISQAYLYKKEGYEIDYLVTLDNDFVKYKEEIHEITGIEIYLLK